MAPKDVASESAEPTDSGEAVAARAAAVKVSDGARSRWPLRRVARYVGGGLIAIGGPLIALTVGAYIYLAGGRFVATDNAYVKAAKIVVSADISGRVTEVAVGENQAVRPGDLLFRIDPAPFQIAFARADARVLSSRQSVEALRAAYKQKLANLERSRSDVVYRQQLFDIQKTLSRKNLVSGLNLETATRNLRDARDQVRVTEQDVAEAQARLGGDPEIAADRHPDVLEAVAQRDQAKLDLGRTTVRAGMAGVVTNFDLQRGEHVSVGRPIFSLVSSNDTWVHANYKETELTHVRVGQTATIAVDSYPGKTFQATVAGISPATGAEFALLPPQNATGNWVKVVQRLTVRLKLNGGHGATPLRAGMSAIVEIDTGHQRRLPEVLSIVLGRGSGAKAGSGQL